MDTAGVLLLVLRVRLDRGLVVSMPIHVIGESRRLFVCQVTTHTDRDFDMTVKFKAKSKDGGADVKVNFGSVRLTGVEDCGAGVRSLLSSLIASNYRMHDKCVQEQESAKGLWSELKSMTVRCRTTIMDV